MKHIRTAEAILRMITSLNSRLLKADKVSAALLRNIFREYKTFSATSPIYRKAFIEIDGIDKSSGETLEAILKEISDEYETFYMLFSRM